MALLREIRLNWQPSRMTSAPLTMVMCNHSVSDAALGIQWHVIGMEMRRVISLAHSYSASDYAPSWRPGSP
jgi:hypothetical protein